MVSDPWANREEVKDAYNIKLQRINENSKLDSIIVAVGHQEFRNISVAKLKSYCANKNPVLVDVKSIYNKQSAIDAGFSVFRL